jgi:hypothetical protein
MFVGECLADGAAGLVGNVKWLSLTVLYPATITGKPVRMAMILPQWGGQASLLAVQERSELPRGENPASFKTVQHEEIVVREDLTFDVRSDTTWSSIPTSAASAADSIV